MVPLWTFISFTFYLQKCQTETYQKHSLYDNRCNITDEPKSVSTSEKVSVHTL